jgi:RHS repeat-associated protein
MTYDARHRITENKLFNPPNTIARYSYSYDSAGNILGIQDLIDSRYSRTFGYDDLNRLTTANTGTALWGTGSYAYDAMGNLMSRSLGTAPVDDGTVLSVPGRRVRASAAVTGVVDKLSFTYNSPTPEVLAATWNGLDHRVKYDDAGNETSYFASRTYSPRNLLATVTDNSGDGTPHTLSYGYDARGVRVTRSESPTSAGTANRYFIYSPELQLVSITDDDSSNLWASGHASIMSAPMGTSHDFGYFNGAPIAELGPPRTPDSTVALSQPRHATPFALATTLYYTFTDHLGTPLLQTDGSANVVWRAEHEPYGNVYLMRKGSRTDQPLRLPGQDLAMTWEGTEENYNVFRWYRAGWGRYTQADPIGVTGGVNVLEYALDSPIRVTDPTGLCAKCDECPSGEWMIDSNSLFGGPGLSFGGSIGIGRSVFIGSFICKDASQSRPNRAQVDVITECTTVGLMLGGGVGATGPVGVAPSACGCKSDDLLGTSTGWTGSLLFLGVDTGACSTNSSKRTWTMSMAKSVGAGFAYSRCTTRRR